MRTPAKARRPKRTRKLALAEQGVAAANRVVAELERRERERDQKVAQ